MNTPALARTRGCAAALVLSMLAGQPGFAQAPAAPGAASGPGVAATSADIRDIRAPKAIPSPWLLPLIIITGLLAIGGGAAGWTWYRRRLRDDGRRPSELALERLERARQLMLPDRGREFSIEVSSVVRGYIESRFGVRAVHLTTHEFLHALLEHWESPLAGHRSLLENFLETCDLGKFGGWNLAASDMESMLQSARRFVLESGEGPEPNPGRPHPTSPVQPPLTAAAGERYASLSST